MNHIEKLNIIVGKKLSIQDFNDLKMFERLGHKLCERYCNGEIDDRTFDKQMEAIKTKVRKILNNTKSLHFNYDPRGYFIKLNCSKEYAIDRDWGGYGIVCPI